MATITTRSGKGSPLTNNEVDANFNNLNTDKLELSGGTLTGNLSLGDNVKAQFGAGNDLQIYHNGTASYVEDAGTGNLRIKTNGVGVQVLDGSDLNLAVFNAGNGQSQLYNVTGGASTLRLATSSYGIDITGRLVTTSHIDAPDNARIRLGDGDDLQIYHDGSNSYISDQGTGNLRILGDEVLIANAANNEFKAVFNSNGAASLYYDGSPKLATTSTGIDVTGSVVASGDLQLGSDSVASNINALGDVFVVNVDSNNNTGGTPNIQFKTSGSEKLRVSPTGIDVTGTATMDGLVSVLGSDAQGKFSGWSPTGSTSNAHGAIELGSNASYQGIIAYDGSNNTRFLFDNSWSGTGSTFEFRTNTAATAKTHLKIEGSGDISFYEDTGTTPKFFWDASAESLGIGVTNPNASYAITANKGFKSESGIPNFTLVETDSSNQTWQINSTGASLSFRDISRAADRLTINTAGNATFSGSVTIPDYVIHDGNTATKFGFGSANTMNFISNGSDRLTIANSYAVFNGAGTDYDFRVESDNNTHMLFVDGGNNQVGIGTSSPSAKLGINASAPDFTLLQSDAVKYRMGVSNVTNGGVTGSASGDYFARTSGGKMFFSTNDGVTAHAVIDSSGNLLVGTTSTDPNSTAGAQLAANGRLLATVDGSNAGYFNRLTSDGELVRFEKDGTTVGSIGTANGDLHIDGGASHSGIRFQAGSLLPRLNGADTNGTIDLGYDDGSAIHRFKNLHLSGYAYVGALKTSASIESLSNLTFWVPNVGEAVRIQQNTGNVGIGVVPETWLSTVDVLQVGLGASFAGNTVNPSRTYLSANYYINSSNQESYIATDEASQYFQNAGTHTFKVAPSGSADSAISWTTAMTIDNSGNVGIGTSSIPTGVRTKIKGLAEATNLATSATSAALFMEPYSGSSWGLGIGSVTGQKQYIQAVSAAGDGTKELLLQPFGGNVGIGTTNPLQKLTVSGSMWASGYYITALQGNSQLTNASTSSGSNPSYIGQGLISVTVSDAKAKENFGSVETNECLNKVVSLAEHVKKFDWIDEDWKKEKGRTVGMVAQEIYEDHSEFVHKPENYNDDGWAIRHQEMVPTLVKAIQEQQTLIKSLTDRIAALEE